MPSPTPRLTVIGAGHLGRSLARLWQQAGVFTLLDVVTTHAASAQDAVRFIGGGQPQVSGAPLAAADVYLIATPDNQISAAAKALAAHGKLNSAQTVFHCSGALTAAALGAAAPARLASIHPILSFAQPEQAISNFAGTWCGAEGEAEALARLIPAFEALGARVVPVESNKKILYHAAAVIGSNYLVTLMEAALQAYEAAGIARADAMQMLKPLAGGALDNALRVGPAQALSGPIARGDWETVRRQEQALRTTQASLADFYSELARRTEMLASAPPPAPEKPG
jgi:predicted short-subunit dehydrogenase-like oxidoreductase (DUF2520 family)